MDKKKNINIKKKKMGRDKKENWLLRYWNEPISDEDWIRVNKLLGFKEIERNPFREEGKDTVIPF